MPATPLPTTLNGPALSDREAIADACFRTTASIDHASEDLYWSAVTDDIHAEVAGKSVDNAQDLKTLVWDEVIKVDTIHYLTNMRISIEAPTVARVTFTSLAVHVRRGKGFEPGNRFTTGAIYNCEAVKVGEGVWKMRSWCASHVWGDGDPAVMVA